jgi:hypothetical protein
VQTEQATALLAALEAEHGPGVLAALLGAGWRAEEKALHAEASKEDEEQGEEPTPFEEWLFEAETERHAWVSAFADHEAFREAAGL